MTKAQIVKELKEIHDQVVLIKNNPEMGNTADTHIRLLIWKIAGEYPHLDDMGYIKQ